MLERALQNPVLVRFDVVDEPGLQPSRRGASSLAHHLVDSIVEALYHAVGLRVARRAQAVLNAQRLAAHVELVFSRWRALFAGEAVGELAAVVGQQFGDLH